VREADVLLVADQIDIPKVRARDPSSSERVCWDGNGERGQICIRSYFYRWPPNARCVRTPAM